jgi:predicted dehydrogenase
MAKPVTVAVLGAGNRGQRLGNRVKISGEGKLAEVVAVAEPREGYRQVFAGTHHLPEDRVFATWQQFVAQPKMCDAVIIATMDNDHVAPTLASLEKGYQVLLEKPMATRMEDCRTIAAAQQRAAGLLAVCHGLRYHKALHRVKELIDAGLIGRIITIDLLEQVAFFHQAHSFVRGNWGKEADSAFMLLTKSCHDIDYLAYLADRPCRRVASFGALSYFSPENAPAGSTERCTDGCAVERQCPYSAIKQYVEADLTAPPANLITPVPGKEANFEAITTGPYGRCVFRAGNDVVDHQVVLLEFADALTATFTMSAFAQRMGRKLRVHGTEGEINFNENEWALTLRTFAEAGEEKVDLGERPGGHGGGDQRVVDSWLEAIQTGNSGLILTDAQESLRTHTITFAAEQSRREGRVVEL